MTTKTRLEHAMRGALGLVLWVMGAAMNLVAVAWLGFQTLRWLQTGAWTNQPTLFSWVGDVCPGACSFATNPHSWFGAAKLIRLLQEIPSGMALAILGFAFAILSVSVSDNRPEPPPVRKSRTLAPF
jgi:hypothetical protein